MLTAGTGIIACGVSGIVKLQAVDAALTVHDANSFARIAELEHELGHDRSNTKKPPFSGGPTKHPRTSCLHKPSSKASGDSPAIRSGRCSSARRRTSPSKYFLTVGSHTPPFQNRYRSQVISVIQLDCLNREIKCCPDVLSTSLSTTMPRLYLLISPC
jgi:hypothetical protein